MRKLNLFLCTLIAALLTSTACATFPGPIRDFGKCLASSMESQVDPIIDAVKSALASKNFIALLIDLGKRVGFDVVDCAVAAILGNASSAPGVISPTEVDHAQAWLSRGSL